jgi:hypothetical protein
MSPKALLLVAALLFTTACASNPKPQTAPEPPEERPEESVVKVYPLNSLAGISGATVWIDYKIARHPDNRSYMVRWGDEGGLWGGTGRNLEGENEPYTFPRIFVDQLYVGSYEARLTVVRSENGKDKEYHTVQRFTVQ